MCWTKLDSDEVSGMLTTDAWHDLAGTELRNRVLQLLILSVVQRTSRFELKKCLMEAAWQMTVAVLVVHLPKTSSFQREQMLYSLLHLHKLECLLSALAEDVQE